MAGVPVVCAFIAALVAFSTIRTEWQAVAIAVCVALPLEFAPGLGGVVRSLPPGLLLLTVVYMAGWVAGRGVKTAPALLYLGGTLALVLVTSFVAAGLVSRQTLPVVLLFALTFVAPAVLPVRVSRPDFVEACIVAGISVVAAYGCLEALMKSNPLLGGYYASPTVLRPLLQEWSTYRVTTLLGHPLVNATVFASGLVLAVARRALGRSGRVEFTICVPLLLAGLAVTYSRGSVAAAVAALFVFLVAMPRTAGTRLGSRLGLVAALGLLSVVGFFALQSRAASTEGTESASVRAEMPALVAQSLGADWALGAGPGQAASRVEASGATTKSGVTTLESIYAEIAVSIGYLGLAVWVATVLGVVLVGLRRQPAAAAASLSVLISTGSFIALEVNARLLAFLGILMLLAMQPPGEPHRLRGTS